MNSSGYKAGHGVLECDGKSGNAPKGIKMMQA